MLCALPAYVKTHTGKLGVLGTLTMCGHAICWSENRLQETGDMRKRRWCREPGGMWLRVQGKRQGREAKAKGL